MTRLLSRSASLLLSIALAGCAGSIALAGCGGSNPRRAHTPTTRYVAPGPGAPFYRTEAAADAALRGPYAAALERAIVQAEQQSSHPLIADARLGELAAWIAEVVDPQGSPPPNDAIDLVAHHLGLVEPAPHLLVLAQGDAERLEARVADEVARILPQLGYTHFGAASVQRDGSTLAVVALSWRWLSLAPLPRKADPGTTLRLEGRLEHGLSGAQLVVLAPDGSSRRSEVQKGAVISLPLPLPTRGEYRIELLGNAALGETVVANFPLYAGVVPTTEISVAGDADARTSEPQAVASLLQLLNADRKRYGLPPLALHEELGKVARAHSEDMQVHGFVGHTSPTTGNPEDRVHAAGIRTQLVLENIGRGYSPEEVERGLMESPGHRENVLNPLATHVGIGVALESEDRRVAYLVTQLFARFARKIDVAAAPALLLDAINAARKRHGQKPLTSDRTLASLCAATASAVFEPSAPPRQTLVEQLNQRAAHAHVQYTRITALLTLVSALEDASALDAVLDPRARAIGVAVAQGTRKDTIENAIAVVVVIGY